MSKVIVTAVQSFSHGNVDAVQGKSYKMNKGDAEELQKRGFVEMGGDGEAGTQADEVRQVKQKGDVVVDDADDLLGDSKMDSTLSHNKMEKPAANKGKK